MQADEAEQRRATGLYAGGGWGEALPRALVHHRSAASGNWPAAPCSSATLSKAFYGSPGKRLLSVMDMVMDMDAWVRLHAVVQPFVPPDQTPILPISRRAGRLVHACPQAWNPPRA